MLFQRGVSGTRTVERGKTAIVGGVHLLGFGAHHRAYPCDYLTVAAAIGTSKAEIEEFVARLKRCAKEFGGKH